MPKGEAMARLSKTAVLRREYPTRKLTRCGKCGRMGVRIEYRHKLNGPITDLMMVHEVRVKAVMGIPFRDITDVCHLALENSKNPATDLTAT
jgi:hypothetical protein